jgi:hypothetical protein
MSTFVLLVLIGSAFLIQYHVDARRILGIASENGWSALRVRWAPFARGWAMRSRAVRSYWLSYRDGSGRPERRLCLVGGGYGVRLEDACDQPGEPRLGSTGRGARAPASRLQTILVWTCVGGFLGLALGIGGSLLLFPSSNIAPAYGILLLAPLGLGAGLLFGTLRDP